MDKIKIIIVDDHTVVLDGLKKLVESNEKFEVVATAQNGEEAIKMVDIFHPNVVIMDLDMPVMNGIEATKRISEQFPETKILALTMHHEKAVVNKLIKNGALGFVLKNVDQEELIEAIEKVADGKQYIGSNMTMNLLQNESTELSKSKELLHSAANLTDREIEILKLIAQGLTNKEIGEKLFISHRTVDTHRTNLQKKLNVKNIAGLIRFTYESGIMNT